MNIFNCFFSNKEIIVQLIKKEVIAKYKGSYLGLLWSFVTPLIMLAVYTFVFSVVFKAKWKIDTDETGIHFALVLFCGLIVFNLFSECMLKAPTLISSYPHYVKKIVFPLEVLPISVLGAALFHYCINMIVLLVGLLIFSGLPSGHIFLLPLIIIPLCMFALGMSWFLSSLGVFIKDISYGINIFVQLLFFLTPIFYPLSAVPDKFRFFLRLNILSTFVEQARDIIVFNQSFNWGWWAVCLIISSVIFILGYKWFMKTKKAFADVI